MEGETLVAVELLAHLGVLVSGMVVEDYVDALTDGDLALDHVKEADELLMAVALHVAADHRALEHVGRREQRGGAATLVVAGHDADASLLQRQPGLGAIERLDLALLVEGQDNRVSGGST